MSIDYSVNPFTSDVIAQNLVGRKIALNTYYADRGLVEYFPNGVQGVITKRVVLLNGTPTFWRSKKDPDWFLVRLSLPVNDGIHLDKKVLIKFKEPHESLNARKHFQVQFLLIPNKIKKPTNMRQNFTSLGWVFLRDWKPKTV